MIIVDIARGVAETVGWLVLIVSVMILFELHPVGWTIGFAAVGACMVVLAFEILRHITTGNRRQRAAAATVQASSKPLPDERRAPPKRPQIDPFKQGE